MRLGAEAWFRPDRRLGILLPDLPRPWEDLDASEKLEAAAVWESIRAGIPDRIRELEADISRLLERLSGETDFAACCRLNAEIADLAGRINELNIWFRTEPDVGDEGPAAEGGPAGRAASGDSENRRRSPPGKR
jgi:hypothetical protein